MTNKTTIYAEYDDIQENWIRRQIESSKHDSFINQAITQKEIKKAGIAYFATPEVIDMFRDKHLFRIREKKTIFDIANV